METSTLPSILNYQPLEILHQSDCSTIYRALEQQQQRSVILKVLNESASTPANFMRFRAEYEIISQLSGTDRVTPHMQLLAYNNSLVLVLEDVGAAALTTFLASGSLNLEAKLTIAVALATQLESLHRQKVIHKAINPSNILWNSAQKRLYLIDFGHASRLEQEQVEFQHSHQIEGNLHYISPEQTGRLNRALDCRSDLYSLGITLYELFTGTLPFQGLEGIEVLQAHLVKNPVEPYLKSRELPLALSNIIMSLIAKSPDDRYQSGIGIKADLQSCLEQLQQAQTITPFQLKQRDYSTQFRLPSYLYGRKQEVRSILNSFERTAQGEKELVLVSGLSGTGKTALVHELYKPLTAQQGLFISGKFEQYQTDSPYMGWISAIRQLVSLLVQGSDAEQAQWKAQILQGLDNVAGVLTELCPELEQLIGQQPKPPKLGGEMALNRFNFALTSFFQSISRAETPLVIFIDDWQWADAASMSLLRFLMQESECTHLLMICSWRDDEVNSAHPFQLTLDQLRGTTLPTNSLQLHNLSYDDIYKLLEDCLGPVDMLTDLAGFAFSRSRGNAFYLNQLLLELHKEGAISYQFNRKTWVVSARQLDQFKPGHNILELMTHKLKKLTEQSVYCLSRAACIGTIFDLKTLAIILKADSRGVASWLESAILEGLIRPLDSTNNWQIAKLDRQFSSVRYQFIHDKVQQAAYAQIADEELAQVHLKIAHNLLSTYPLHEIAPHIFKLVKHMNLGREAITSRQDRKQLFELNFMAAKHAKDATAFLSALRYFKNAITAMPEQYWQTHLNDASHLHLLAAETAFLTKEYSLKTQWLDALFEHQKEPLWQVKGLLIQLQSYTAENKLHEAIEVARTALAKLEIKLPQKTGDLYLLSQLLLTKLKLGRLDTNLLMRSNPIIHEQTELALSILGAAIPSAYWANPNLMLIIILRITEMLVKHGHHEIAGFGYAWWGILECALFGNIERGYNFGKFGIQLAQQHDLPVHQARFYWGWVIKAYRHPIRECIAELQQTYRLSLEAGDYEYASYALNNEHQFRFYSAQPLEQVEQGMAQAQKALLRFNNQSSFYWHAIWWQTTQNFLTPTKEPARLLGSAYNETELRPRHEAKSDASTLFLLETAKLMLAIHFNRPEEAIAAAKRGRPLLKAALGMYAASLFYFYESLALLLQKNQGRERLNQRKSHKQILANLKQLKKLARHSPDNHQHKCTLIEALLAQRANRHAEADSSLKLAVQQAQEHGFIQEAALASELRARMLQQQEKPEQAKASLSQARRLYGQWQAFAKLEQLQSEWEIESNR